MLKRISALCGIYILMCTLAHGQSLQRYEHWIDNDVSQRTVVKSTAEDLAISVDLKALSEGVHYFNFRAQDSGNVWGALNRYLFFIPSKQRANPSLSSYEYWIDNDLDSHKSVNSSAEDVVVSYDITALPTGVHYFNFRSRNSNGTYGTLERYLFFIPSRENPNAQLSSYEYWIDNDLSAKTVKRGSDTEIAISYDISTLSAGVHYFNFRSRNSNGTYGALERYLFFIPSRENPNAKLSKYEYWLDNDMDKKTTVNSSSEEELITVDLKDVANGVHYLNYRACNSNGTWGALQRFLFFKPDEVSTSPSPIDGYEYSFGAKKETVSLTQTSVYEVSDMVIPIPSLAECSPIDNSCNFTFTADNVVMHRKTNLPFIMRFKNVSGKWGAPIVESIEMEDSISHNPELLGVQKSVDFEKMTIGDYRVFRMTITESGSYYFKASQPCQIDLYNLNGTLYRTMYDTELLKIKQVGLFEGTYYGVIHSTRTDENYPAKNILIRLLLTEGYVPTPEIAFADGKASIACQQEDAKIYYTTDGNDPTTASTVYTSPFEVLTNITIKAMATFEDLSPSDIATFKVNSYKVEMPTIEFANLKLYMNCATALSRIYYTLDGADPVTNGQLYTEPFSISQNCTVKAVAKRYGYNDSDVVTYSLDVNNVKCIAPVFTLDGNTLTLSSLTEGVTFYYTLDGDDSAATYEKYEGVINLTRNGVVKAYATKDGLLNSETVSYTVDWFKAASPEFDIVDNCIVMVCATENAVMYYTTDGTIPNDDSNKYESPVPMTEGMVVKAITYAKHFNPSDVVTLDAENLRCIMPVFTLADDVLTITSATEGASIYYTLDGTPPTKESNLYDKGIALTENCIVKAFAVKQGRADSYVVSYSVDWFQTETPTFALEGHILTISSKTPNAEIYYTIGGVTPDNSAEKYVTPIELTDNRTVKAIAYAEHFNDSEVSEFIPDVFVCADVRVIYNGRYVALESETGGATIYYTINGNTPSVTSDVYSEPIDINGLATVKAFVVKPDFNDGAISTFAAEYYYNGKDALTSKNGVLSKAFEWCGTENISELNVVGDINGDDVAFLASINSLRHLNIEEADVEDNALSANAFAGSGIVSISLPKTIERVGSGLFEGCQNLAAIQWNASRSLPSSALSGFNNPNLLLYVKINSHAPSNVANVVASDYANTITLHDGEDNTNFYCPQEFTAKHIEYRHNYTQETVKKACAGWETLSLPFDVQTIKHATKGELAPFAANDPEAKPFWLCSLGNYGFVDAAEIKANTPYIISMPNNMEYADDYILGGEVTFSAENVVVPVTTDNTVAKGEFVFKPTTVNVAKDRNVYAINVGEQYESFQPGATFVSDLRDVRPFEAYLTTEMHKAPRMMSVERLGFEDETSLEGLAISKRMFNVHGEYGRIIVITDSAMHIDVYSSLGALVRSEDILVGETYITDLPAGIYFVNGQKVVVR